MKGTKSFFLHCNNELSFLSGGWKKKTRHLLFLSNIFPGKIWPVCIFRTQIRMKSRDENPLLLLAVISFILLWKSSCLRHQPSYQDFKMKIENLS